MRNKHLILRASAGDAPNQIRVTASTEDPDRMDDVVDQSWILDDYRKNPVILWGHDYSRPPIGRALDVAVVDGKLQATIEFDESQDLGATVARQFAEGFLNAVSVGFSPGRRIPRSQLAKEDPRHKEGGWGVVFHDNVLLEISAVPVPANGNALAQREVEALVAKGLPVPLAEDPGIAIREWFERGAEVDAEFRKMLIGEVRSLRADLLAELPRAVDEALATRSAEKVEDNWVEWGQDAQPKDQPPADPWNDWTS